MEIITQKMCLLCYFCHKGTLGYMSQPAGLQSIYVDKNARYRAGSRTRKGGGFDRCWRANTGVKRGKLGGNKE